MAVYNSPGISLVSENHGDPQCGRSYSLATCHPPLAALKLDDVAKVRSAVSRYLLDTTYGVVADLRGCLCYRLVDFLRSTVGRAQRIRERNVRRSADHKGVPSLEHADGI